MGTPGDKAKIGKVVQGSQLDPDQESVSPTTTAATASTSTPTAESPVIPPLPQPSTSATMGMISRLPQFETFAAINIHPSLSQTAGKPETFQSTTMGALGQAHMEDYYTQTKHYPSVSENLQTIYHPVMTPKPKTFLSLDEPGPSGLQTQKTKTKLSVKRTKKSSQIQKKGHSCPVCQKNFATIDKLTKHQQIHSGTSPFKCEHCKKSFSSKFKLVRHVLIHSDRKPFSCTVCERTFHRKDHLKNHIKVHSPSKKVYVCEKADCKKEYTSLMSYRKHLALHAAEEGSLQCQICSSVFSTKEEILYHLKIHAGSRTVKNPNEKKFTCEHCDRKFFTKKDVRRHLVVHTGMRDFLCQFCPQRFGRKDHLVRHIKKSHSKNVPPEDFETAIKSEIPETIVKPELVIKTDPEIKSEFFESSLSNPEQIDLSFEDVSSILQEETFDPLTRFLEPDTEGNLTFLPSPESQEELKDLGSTILEEIGEPSMIGESLTDPDEEILGQSVLNNPELQRLLEPSEDKNLPLPGFSQTFQPPPPPPP
ncbi:zinc finger protein PLAG1 [Tribolium castaneum]|uniref:Zinc finger protein PLAG1-like Protein n=1 Tax=Tribolium castaneum TaxID=7070 RepID=D6WQR3_TRICA|nr:PREDICTED: zinc finger protein PLAG1 [Tribolium castaneum]XP_015837540.1 PREDICTED: zinc finger protein PLAG1 [Tribolium castaneum]XP_975272.1 PREDICTED: zinc finger protein PLAG1 [Tribolium castaneum]EFA06038.1 Zinc finger protein PLAG1-like Protein [Tribolium castaneum]|eukprot:XP_015837539.1 PREDICTED: zinc finger protein PLAG1 [Tribolium castaneum]